MPSRLKQSSDGRMQRLPSPGSRVRPGEFHGALRVAEGIGELSRRRQADRRLGFDLGLLCCFFDLPKPLGRRSPICRFPPRRRPGQQRGLR